jgi:hypothetical protein
MVMEQITFQVENTPLAMGLKRDAPVVVMNQAAEYLRLTGSGKSMEEARS